MRKLPIPFSDPMVAAILAGRKRQTRRILDPQPGPGQCASMYPTAMIDWQVRSKFGVVISNVRLKYRPGDLLWVRETYYQFGHWEPAPGATTKGGRMKWAFTPDDPAVSFEMLGPYLKAMNRTDPTTPAWHKRLGRFMPRAASRITLRVTGVKVERLQDISEANAIAEGMVQQNCPGEESHGAWSGGVDFLYGWNARGAFRRTWELINGAGSWEANPWVVAYEFEPIFSNIDTVGVKG